MKNEDEKAVQAAAKAADAAKPEGETLHYTGVVKDKDTGKPIAGATVVVRRSVLRSADNRVLQETRHTTGADGTYAFTIPPEQVAERYLYIELDVEHPDYATRAGFGYALSMIRKNEGLGERPFFETVELRPAAADHRSGRDARGRAGGRGQAPGVLRHRQAPQGGDRVRLVRQGQDGRRRAVPRCRSPPRAGASSGSSRRITPPRCTGSPDGKRGDLGTFTLKKGVTLTGRALDVEGKPLAGLLIEADRERGSGPEFEALGQLIVADAIERTTETDAEGRFTFDPLPPGPTGSCPPTTTAGGDRSAGRTRREVPGVFAPKKLTIKEGETSRRWRSAPRPTWSSRGSGSTARGSPRGAGAASVFGRIDGSFWHAMTQPDAQGKFSLKVPHGLEDVQLDIIDQRARLGATPDRQGRAADRGPERQARHARPRRQGDRDRPLRGPDHRDQRHDEGRQAGQGLQGRPWSTPSPARTREAKVHLAGGGRRPRPSRTSRTTAATARRSSCPTAR